jgi:hypothetical protein
MIDMLNLDPYTIQSGLPQWLNNTKRIFEFNYQGWGTCLRVRQCSTCLAWCPKHEPQREHTTDFYSAWLRRVPEQLYPQMAKWIVDG